MRLHAQSPGFENGLVLLPREAPWLIDYVGEITSFPGGRYDDQVDSTTQALDHMRAECSGLEIWARLAP
jgi:predicted phage terminase large subunit-like protein